MTKYGTQNASVQKNIIGFSDFDQDLYNKVLYCTDLESDISLFPDGDQTLIGSKGVTLSGGQKQRLVSAHYPFERSQLKSGFRQLLELCTQEGLLQYLTMYSVVWMPQRNSESSVASLDLRGY